LRPFGSFSTISPIPFSGEFYMNTKFFATAFVSLAAASTLMLSGCFEDSSTMEGTEPVAVEEMPAEGAMGGMMDSAKGMADGAAAAVGEAADGVAASADHVAGAAHDATDHAKKAVHDATADHGDDHAAEDHHG
jgi:hypothetical protein